MPCPASVLPPCWPSHQLQDFQWGLYHQESTPGVTQGGGREKGKGHVLTVSAFTQKTTGFPKALLQRPLIPFIGQK